MTSASEVIPRNAYLALCTRNGVHLCLEHNSSPVCVCVCLEHKHQAFIAPEGETLLYCTNTLLRSAAVTFSQQFSGFGNANEFLWSPLDHYVGSCTIMRKNLLIR